VDFIMARLAKIVAFNRKPKFAVRKKNRCELCGRAHAFLRDFKMCRICFRQLALRGMIPGVTKASW
jgi:small subunit ribosomal protein S14